MVRDERKRRHTKAPCPRKHHECAQGQQPKSHLLPQVQAISPIQHAPKHGMLPKFRVENQAIWFPEKIFALGDVNKEFQDSGGQENNAEIDPMGFGSNHVQISLEPFPCHNSNHKTSVQN